MKAKWAVRERKIKAKKRIIASKWDRERTATLYTCGVHFQHEMAEAMGPQVFYNSLTEFKKAESCWRSCGIVQVKVSFSRWLRPETIGEGMREAKMMVTPAERVKPDKGLKIQAELWFKYISDLRKLHTRERSAVLRRKSKR